MVSSTDEEELLYLQANDGKKNLAWVVNLPLNEGVDREGELSMLVGGMDHTDSLPVVFQMYIYSYSVVSLMLKIHAPNHAGGNTESAHLDTFFFISCICN